MSELKSGRLKLLLFPLLLFAAAYGLDKLFYVGDVEDYFVRSASHINYDHKEQLLYDLQRYLKRPQRRKVMVVFGNSRTTTFPLQYIQDRYAGWTLFNFSVPGGNADYYYYLMGRFLELQLRPEFVFFAVDPQGYNTSPRISMDEVMINGLPVSFVAANAAHFPVSDLSNYAAKKLFWNYQYRPKLRTLIIKLKDRKLHIGMFRMLKLYTYFRMVLNQGSIPPDAGTLDHKQDKDFLEKTAAGTKRDFLSPYRLAENQFYFTRRALALASELGVPAALLWARVGPPLRRIVDKDRIVQKDGTVTTIRKLWEPRMLNLARSHRVPLLDMNYGPTISCDRYHDASHLAGICFPEFADYLIKHADRGAR